MRRFTEIDPNSNEELQSIASHVLRTRKENIVKTNIPSLFGILFHRPKIAEAFSVLGNELRHNGLLSDRERDLVILQVSRLTRCEFLWHVHRERIVASGRDRNSLYRLEHPDLAWFDVRDLAVLAYAKAMTVDVVVPDAIHAATRQHFSEPEMVELAALTGFYNLNTRLLVAFGIDCEDGRTKVPLPFATT